MQYYFVLKESLKGTAKQVLFNLESQLDTPKWVNFIPEWFHADAEDWMGLARGTLLQPEIRVSLCVDLSVLPLPVLGG